MTLPYPDSLYAAAIAIPPPRPRLQTRLRARVAVIGCGYTGLSAALSLAQAGIEIVALEASRIGTAASGRNGGQVHSGFNVDQHRLEAWFGADKAQSLWRLAQKAKTHLQRRMEQSAIACEWRNGILLAAHNRRAADALRAKVAHLNHDYAYEQARYLGRDETAARTGSTIYHGAAHDAGGGHLQPLALALDLARAAEDAGAIVFEESRVLDLETRGDSILVRTAGGEVSAEHVILACDARIAALAPALAPYLADIESYLIATAPLDAGLRPAILPHGEAVADTRRALDYYRLTPDRRLVFAGGETTLARRRDIEALVRPRLARVFPQLAEVPIARAWSGTVAVTRTRLPHFGRLGPRIAFGYGYSGQGVALAMLGGHILAEAVQGASEDFDLLASLPAEPYPLGNSLRQPLMAATVLGSKLLDLI